MVIEVFPIALQPGARSCSFEVRDTGIGMPPEVVERLFEPFTQGDVSTTRQHGGAGLGLAIVRRLVTLMGGRIDVSTRPKADPFSPSRCRSMRSTTPRNPMPRGSARRASACW